MSYRRIINPIQYETNHMLITDSPLHLSLPVRHHQRVEPEVAPVRDLAAALLHEGVPRERPRRDGVGGPEEGGARPGGVVGLAGQLVRRDVVDVERVFVAVLRTRQQAPHLFDESRLEAGDHGGAADDDEVPDKEGFNAR